MRFSFKLMALFVVLFPVLVILEMHEDYLDRQDRRDWDIEPCDGHQCRA